MINLMCTADYELFFSKNDNPEDILIHPTDRLLKIFSKYQLPITLFADVCCMIRLKELGDKFVEKMEEQLISALKSGHDVQLHIHPHWLFSNYDDGKWRFDGRYYKVHSLGFDRNEKDIRKSAYALIKRAKEYLEQLLIKADPDYKCFAFRAGGWCIQPEPELVAALSEIGITIDSSVIYGRKSTEEINDYDYSNVPAGNYFFKDTTKIKINKTKGCLFEVPVVTLTFPWNLVKFLHIKMFTPKKKQIYLKNQCNFIVGKNQPAGIKKYFSKYFGPLTLTFDGQIYEDNLYIIRHFMNKKDLSSIALVTHPKVYCEQIYTEIEMFIRIITDQYRDKIRFSLFKDINLN
jgi:hypothetical protein